MTEVADSVRLLTSRRAADRLGVSTDTIRALAKAGVLPPILYGERGLYRFRAGCGCQDCREVRQDEAGQSGTAR